MTHEDLGGIIDVARAHGIKELRMGELVIPLGETKQTVTYDLPEDVAAELGVPGLKSIEVPKEYDFREWDGGRIIAFHQSDPLGKGLVSPVYAKLLSIAARLALKIQAQQVRDDSYLVGNKHAKGSKPGTKFPKRLKGHYMSERLRHMALAAALALHEGHPEAYRLYAALNDACIRDGHASDSACNLRCRMWRAWNGDKTALACRNKAVVADAKKVGVKEFTERWLKVA